MRETGRGWVRGAVAFAAVVLLATCSGGGGGGDGGGGGGGGTPNGVANAGGDTLVTFGDMVALDGSGSHDPDGDALTYRWTQVSGPDVTGGTGTFTGMAPSFPAPMQTASLVFDLTVDDGKGASAPARWVVNVVENCGAALFVDGAAADGGDGSPAAPFRTITQALDAARGKVELFDVYVMTLAGGAAYDERAATLEVPGGTSLFGGYGPGWVRDVANRTVVLGARRALSLTALPHDTWISGFAIAAAGSASAAEETAALWVDVSPDDPGTLFVEDDRLEAGDVGDGTAWIAGSSYGVLVNGAAAVEVARSTIVAGAGGDGAKGSSGTAGIIGQGFFGGNGGAGGTGMFGGDGGRGQAGCSSAGGTATCAHDGGGGGAPGTALAEGGGNGGAPTPLAAADGAYGDGGGGAGHDFPYEENPLDPTRYWTGPGFLPGVGRYGTDGSHGRGGGGGGGGASDFWGYVGGAGGRGGHGGSGGGAGWGGGGGGASIGVWLAVANAIVTDSEVMTASGGPGAEGGDGGAGGSGAGGEGGLAGDGGGRGGTGGGGGTGGNGGKGGAGGGGPSFGVVVGSGTTASITENTLVAGKGGDGGVNPAGYGGEGGYSFSIYDLDLLDGAPVAESGNEFGYAEPSTGSPAGAVGAHNW